MIKIISGEKTIELHNDDYALVSETIKGNNFSMPCGGNGNCFKCKVILKGETSEITDTEKKVLSEKEIENGVRLACFSKIRNGEIIINEAFDYKGIENDFFSYPESIKTDEEYVACIDIGTTTVAGCLYNTKTGKKEKELLETNALISFGADVISRIEYSRKNGTEKLTALLTDQTNNMISSLLSDKKAKITVTGNTVMLNILKGNSISGMGVYPYTPESLFGEEVIFAGKKVYLPRCISSFVGADISCALAASDIFKNKTALLLDMGTNGEIVLKNGEFFICTSVAAGPAFEGAGLSMGMGAVKGAVARVFAQGTNLKYKTIGNDNPKGICGSGIIDAISVLKKHGALEESGKIKEASHPFSHLVINKNNETRIYLSGTDVYITENDIRSVMVAASSFKSGITALLAKENVATDEIECIYISGAFGNFIDVKNACELGVIPSKLYNKVKLIGNGALNGAIAISLNPEAEKKSIRYETLDLSCDKLFAEEFIKNMKI